MNKYKYRRSELGSGDVSPLHIMVEYLSILSHAYYDNECGWSNKEVAYKRKRHSYFKMVFSEGRIKSGIDG